MRRTKRFGLAVFLALAACSGDGRGANAEHTKSNAAASTGGAAAVGSGGAHAGSDTSVSSAIDAGTARSDAGVNTAPTASVTDAATDAATDVAERDAGGFSDGGSLTVDAGVCAGGPCGSATVMEFPGTPTAITDPNTGLQWMNPPAAASEPLAVEYCDALALDGHDDWRLPSIDELRSMIRGCPNDEAGGACAATATCTSVAQCYGCVGCDKLQGPGPSGCYWPDAFGSDRCGPYWSSTPQTDETDPSLTAHWCIEFDYGAVVWTWSYLANFFRCVRG